MAGIATVRIARKGDDLRFGRHIFPIRNADSLWVKNGKDRLVTVVCAKGDYRTHLHFWMQCAEEMCRLVCEVMRDERVKIHLPHFVAMIPKPHPKASRSMIEFPMVHEEDMALFDSYTTLRFLKPISREEAYDREDEPFADINEIVREIREKMPAPLLEKSWEEAVRTERHYEILSKDAESGDAVGIVERLHVEDGTGEPLWIASSEKRVHEWMAQPEKADNGVDRHAGVLEKRFRHLWKKDPLKAVALLRLIKKIDGLNPYLHLFACPDRR